MEIIHTYMSDETEICVISDGSTIHLADKNDLAVESPGVGTVVRPSQMNEVYLEMPISVLQEAARRSEVVIEPDSEEEESSDDSSEEESEDEEEAALPPWQPVARKQFFGEYALLDDGVDVSVLINFPVKIRWDEEEESSWHTTDGSYDLTQALEAQEGLKRAVESFNQRIKNLITAIQDFTKTQEALGHSMDESSVENFLNDELAKSKSDPVADAAE